MDYSQIYREYPQLRIGYGEVQGRLKVVPGGGGKCRYVVAEQLTDREVECVVPAELAATADAAAAEQRRVELSGKVYRNAEGDSERVEVSWILVMPADDEVPSLDELVGSLPDITDGLTTEEFLRIMRDDNAYYEYTANADQD